MRIDLKNDALSLTEFDRTTKRHAGEFGDADESRADQRLRAAVESYAKGDRGTEAGMALQALRERAGKSRSSS